MKPSVIVAISALLASCAPATPDLDADAILPVADFTVDGGRTSAHYGLGLAGGDLNGDGYGDMVSSSPDWDQTLTDQGRVWTYSGSASGLGSSAAWTMDGDQASSGFGTSVATGDVNGDGWDDLVVGAPKYDNGSANEGRVYVYLGSASGLASTAWTWEPDQAAAAAGQSVAFCDVNGDGSDDLLVGAYLYDNGHADEGAVFVFHGSASGLGSAPTARIEGNSNGAWSGFEVACAGSTNGDAYEDVLVGMPGWTSPQTREGRAQLYLGSASGVLTTSAWAAEPNQSAAYFGYNLSAAGDVNGDGYDDVLIGSHRYDNGQVDEGKVWLYLGAAGGLAKPAAWVMESNQANAYLSGDISAAGDVNGDGYDDFLVASYLYDGTLADEGVVWLFLGASSLSPAIDPGRTRYGAQLKAWQGYALAGLGDVDGDGLDDFAWSAPYYDNGLSNEGAVFVEHGLSSYANADGDPDPDLVDCDSGDSSTYHGAPELCDGYDNDCDGTVDEGLTANTYYTDADADGYGDPSSTVTACAMADGVVDNGEDCLDSDAAIHPAATEVCDTVDNDCDDTIDEGGVCVTPEEEVLDLVNAVRATGYTCHEGTFGPTSPLAWQSQLATAALAHSQDMATNDFFDHTGSTGSTVVDRIEAAGYLDWSDVGENIVAGFTDPADVVEAWLNSPAGHCGTLMDPVFTDAGIGSATNPSSAYGIYWTLVVAASF